MRRNNTESLKNVLREYIDSLGHRRKLKQVSIISEWKKLVGPFIAKHTKQIYIKNKVLFVSLDSPVLRNELLMQKEKLISHLNDYAGEIIIEKIVFQ